MSFKIRLTDSEREALREAAGNIMKAVMADIVASCPGWRRSAAVEEAEKAIDRAFDDMMNGTGSLAAYRSACERWKAAGLEGGSSP